MKNLKEAITDTVRINVGDIVYRNVGFDVRINVLKNVRDNATINVRDNVSTDILIIVWKNDRTSTKEQIEKAYSLL